MAREEEQSGDRAMCSHFGQVKRVELVAQVDWVDVVALEVANERRKREVSTRVQRQVIHRTCTGLRCGAYLYIII